jgi:hypothetical protein
MLLTAAPVQDLSDSLLTIATVTGDLDSRPNRVATHRAYPLDSLI